MSVFPAHYQADNSMDVGSGSLQNCQGGSFQTTGTKKAELIATTTDGEEVLLQHEFIVGNVTSCLVSLGQLYQGGWTTHKDDNSNRLSLQSPGNEISIPVEYKNLSFAIFLFIYKIFLVKYLDAFKYSTVYYFIYEIENSPMNTWEMTSDGTPFFRTVTTDYVNPENVSPYWHYRTTLIRKCQKDRTWTVVELSRKFKDIRQPFGMFDQFLITVGFECECESLTLLGVQPQTLLELGLVMTDGGGDVLCDQEELQGTSLRRELPASNPSTSLRRELPASKPSDFQNKHVLPPEGYE